MHITILALGSRGDVIPYAALGEGLKRVGHAVRLATFESFGELVCQHGLDFRPVQGDARAILRSNAGQSLGESGGNLLRMWTAMVRSYGRLAREFARDLTPLVEEETDLVINQLPGGLYGIDLAEKLGAPLVIASVIPLSPTGAFPMMGFPQVLARYSTYNRFTYRIAQQMVWSWFRPTINSWRVDSLGLSPWPRKGYFNLLEDHKIPVLNGFSPQVVPRPHDWGEHIQITGYWFSKERHWKPPEALVEFIHSGPKPVFIGFGSMPVRDNYRIAEVVYKAVEMSGHRAVVHSGWAGLKAQHSPRNIFVIDYAPYQWLFPRMAGVIHHGGSGTAGAGLRAGVPSMAVPFLFDQFYWGERLAALGVGPDPIAFKKLSPERLAGALDILASENRFQERAAHLGGLIRAEAGVENAVNIVSGMDVTLNI